MTVTGARSKVEVFCDRIEFNNLGEPVTDWRKLFGTEPRSSNERLAFAMRKMKLCVGRGSGLRRTVKGTDAARLLPPEFQSGDEFSRVVLHGLGKDFDAMDQGTKIRAIYYFNMLLWEEDIRITNTALRERLPMSGNATVKASAILRACVAAKWLKIADLERPNSGYIPFWA